MKLTVVLGSIVLVAAVGAGLAAQGGANEQTITGCVKGDGSEASAWTLAGVVILPPAPVPPPPPPGGGRGGRGGGREGGPPAAGREGGPPAGGREGAPPAGGGGARGARGGAPAAPPPPPPPPQTFKLTGINMTPWANMRAEVTGTGTNADFKVSNVRSMWGTCQ